MATKSRWRPRDGGTTGCEVEAMEGFGVLRAAQLAGVPAIEVRAISNEIEETDRARWRFDDAFAAIGDRYRLLRSGAALGEGVGPLVVTRAKKSLAEAARGRVAIPGKET